MTWKRPTHELWTALEHQRAALISSAAAYDDGAAWEAPRVAVAISVIVVDGRRTRSLLSQLGILDRVGFANSCRGLSPLNMLAETPLVHTQLHIHPPTNSVSYLPRLDDVPGGLKYIGFKEWWDESVIRDRERRQLSRKDLVLSIRDQDGGAHVDATLRDPVYLGVSRLASLGWAARSTDGPLDFDAPAHLASVRQIAWEIEQTLPAAFALRTL